MANQSSGGGTKQRAMEVKDQAAQQARQTAQEELDTAGSVVETARHEAGEVTRTAGEEARDLYAEVRTNMSGEADDQLARLSSGAQTFAHDLRSMAKACDDPESPAVKVVRQAADLVDGMGGHLEGGADELLDQVRHTARRRPGAFLLGALGAGLVVGRLARNLSDPDDARTIDLTDSGPVGDPYRTARPSIQPRAAEVWAVEETTVAASPPYESGTAYGGPAGTPPMPGADRPGPAGGMRRG